MKYRTSVKNIQSILKISSERTTFRKIDNAVENFCKKLNLSKYVDEVESIMQKEKWIPKTQPVLSVCATASV